MGEYRSAIRYLESFVNYEKLGGYSYHKSFDLARIKKLLRLIGNPQKQVKVIHIAGSKGKGSTCAFTAYILRQAGFSVGLYTSPHLSDFRERIRILRPRKVISGDPFEGKISKNELVKLVESIRPAIKETGKLSFFEVYTALAFVYFREKKVDFAVVETGMGGRLDATNAAEALICAITPISYEHTLYLGKTLAAISAEKAGIIKPGCIVLSAPQAGQAQAVIEDASRRSQAKLFRLGKEIKCFPAHESFSVKGIKNLYTDLKIRLLGRHQMFNAALALGITECLGVYGFEVGVDCARKGLYNTSWPGRLEVLRRKPLVVLDGAQNSASVAVLVSAIKELFRYKNLILVFGVSRDKDIGGIADKLRGITDKAILTCADNPRASRPEDLRRYFSGGKREIFITSGVKEAGRLAAKLAGEDDLILVTGSLFVVGEFRDAYR